MYRVISILFMLLLSVLDAKGYSGRVLVGADQLFLPENVEILKNRRIGLITNHTAIDKDLSLTKDVLKKNAAKYSYRVTAFFAPEHGISGSLHADENVEDEVDSDGIPIFSLHGKTRRPSKEMLKNVDLLIYDIQDIGSRSYTYITTLFYAMEEAAKNRVPVIVLDRPNPINGVVVDGPMLDTDYRSFVGYINVPYCHGMTIGELAMFFNDEYKIGCQLKIIPMKGWKRAFSFEDTGLTWIPTSPQIPESSTANFYPMTGLLGELMIVNIGVGYTLPFKLMGAPWINANEMAAYLNKRQLKGVAFIPFHFTPFYGRFAKKECHGVKIVITDHLKFKPLVIQYLLISALKELYPEEMSKAFLESEKRKEMFYKITGGEDIYHILKDDPHPFKKLERFGTTERDHFLNVRKKYLIVDYL